MSTEHKIRTTKRLAKSKAHRDAFVSAHIKEGLSFQVRALRKQRKWSQKKLGTIAGFEQSKISDFENPNYPSDLNLDTVKRLASAFDVALVIRFVSFGEQISWVSDLVPDSLQVRSFSDDLQCWGWLHASTKIPKASVAVIGLERESTTENPPIHEDVVRSSQIGMKLDSSQRRAYVGI